MNRCRFSGVKKTIDYKYRLKQGLFESFFYTVECTLLARDSGCVDFYVAKSFIAVLVFR